jgi:hypothetical protein
MEKRKEKIQNEIEKENKEMAGEGGGADNKGQGVPNNKNQNNYMLNMANKLLTNLEINIKNISVKLFTYEISDKIQENPVFSLFIMNVNIYKDEKNIKKINAIIDPNTNQEFEDSFLNNLIIEVDKLCIKVDLNENSKDNNEFKEIRKLTDWEKCINELKNQISNVKNCLDYENSFFNVFNELGNKFQNEIMEIRDVKNKLDQFNINSFSNNAYNQFLLNNLINQNQLYQLSLNFQNQNQYQNYEINNKENNNSQNSQKIQNNIVNMNMNNNININNNLINEKNDIKDNSILDKKEDDVKDKLNSENIENKEINLINEEKKEEINMENKNVKKDEINKIENLKDSEQNKEMQDINKLDIKDKNEITNENKEELIEGKDNENKK